jgi:hypothetical protein
MTDVNILRRFWITVLIAVIALGVAWGNWKDPTKSVASVSVAVFASIAFAGSMLVASRFVLAYARATRRARQLGESE